MTAPRIIAEVRGYDEFTAALRTWIGKCGTTYESIGAIAGLQDGYLAKMISRTPVRAFSRMSLDATLAALGVKLVLVVDAEKLAAMKPRYMPRKKNAVSGMLSQRTRVKSKVSWLRDNPDLAKMLHAQWMVRSSPWRRRQIARKAARVRWDRQ